MRQAFFFSMVAFIAISSIAIAQENKQEVTPGKETGIATAQENKQEEK